MVVSDNGTTTLSIVDVLENVGTEALIIVALASWPYTRKLTRTNLRGLYNDQVIHTRPTGFHSATKT